MAYQSAIQALADPTRRAVLERLRRGPLPVGRIARGLPVSRPAVSQHLRVLESAGLVRAREEGRMRIYSVELSGLAELRLYLDRFWTDVLESFRSEAERDLPPAGGPQENEDAPQTRRPRGAQRTGQFQRTGRIQQDGRTRREAETENSGQQRRRRSDA